ncbi:MAG: exodeoxyribonuclease VII small subunit [Clostridia bacterium]|nr:exodeoxyribonuclease VII small subunit [Clostridia bacterium]
MATKKKTFEEALARLEEILAKLERGDGNLDELLGLYEEGVGLIRICNERLESAEQRVKMLQLRPDGGAEMIDFNRAEEEK